MKKKIHTIKAGKYAPLWCILLLLSLFFVACTEDIMFPPNPVNPGEGTAMISLNVKTPHTTLPTSFNRIQTQDETHISELDVFVFEENGDEYLFNYQAAGQLAVGSDIQQTLFDTKLIATDKALKLIVLANARNAFQQYTPSFGATEEEVRQNLNISYTSQGLSDDLPMYGEIILTDGILASQAYTLPVTVLRAIARVDVVKELVTDAPEFILEEIYAFRTNNQIQLIPSHIADASSPKVDTPSIPAAAAFIDSPVRIVANGGAESITQMYIPEAQAPESPDENLNKVTSIIIGGRFNGHTNPVTYYRADFNSRIEGHPFGQVLRNHRYIFKIKKVSCAGSDTPEEAANTISNAIQVDVQTWEDFSSEMYFGNDQFGISARKISLRYTKNREKRLDIQSSIPYKIEWLDDSGTPTGLATDQYNTTISNDSFDATIVKDAYDSETISHLVFRTRKHNHLGNIIENRLRITAGRWTADIIVSQDNSAMYSNRFINILSVQELGNLGVDMLSCDASALAMRKILDVQFSPQGIIRIGGSSFARIPNTTDYVGTSVPQNLAIMKRIIGAQDVIYFPCNIIVSSDVADLLLEWVEGSPHRVLIVGTDSKSTNAELLNKLTTDGEWYFDDISSITTNYARGNTTLESIDFFNGPFGNVTENASFKRADAIAGYNFSYPIGDVTNLISSDKYGDCMFLGVNQKKRIVYNGDANLLHTPQMSNNDGNIISDLDKLMANTWAWITEQVIYGDN